MEVADTEVGVYNVFRINARLGWAAPKEGMGMDPLDIGEDRLKDVPKEFRKYVRLFRKEEEVGLLLRSRWDYTIELKPGIQLGYFKIYPINQKKRTILKDYVDKNVKMGKIRKSKSEAGYSIFFVVKKDGRRRPYVDYR